MGIATPPPFSPDWRANMGFAYNGQELEFGDRNREPAA